MKILFVSALLPYPPHQGGGVRMYNLLKQLGPRHQITLLPFIRSFGEEQYLEKLSFCQKITPVMRGSAWQVRYVVKAAVSSMPLLYASYDNDWMKKAIAQELSRETYDLIHLEPSYVWPSLPKTDVPAVVTEHNIESTVYDGFVRRFSLPFVRPILFWDVVKLRFWERRVWKEASHVIAVSESDAQIIRAATASDHVSVVSNGVDPKKFAFHERKKNMGKRILFVGYFGWLQNRDALTYLLDVQWREIYEAHPGATLRVIGKKLPKILERKVAATGGSWDESVDDIVKEYHTADVLLAPIRIGGGTRYKILDAMATGLPVVTTTIGASGLAAKDHEELLIADTVEATVQALWEVFEDDDLRVRMTRQARSVVEEHYSWDKLAKQLEEVWKHAKTNS